MHSICTRLSKIEKLLKLASSERYWFKITQDVTLAVLKFS